MTIVYDSTLVPAHLGFQVSLSNFRGPIQDIEIYHTRGRMAQGIAELLSRDPKFFEVSTEGEFTQITANVMVLTLEEYKAICEKQFLRGSQQARGLYTELEKAP